MPRREDDDGRKEETVETGKRGVHSKDYQAVKRLDVRERSSPVSVEKREDGSVAGDWDVSRTNFKLVH